jgi:hypothetical protein
MAHLSDIADLIASHRAAAERMFESEIAKLRMTYGDKVVGNRSGGDCLYAVGGIAKRWTLTPKAISNWSGL